MTTMTSFGHEVMEHLYAVSNDENNDFSNLMRVLADGANEIDYSLTHDGVSRTSDETYEAFKTMLEGYADIYGYDMDMDKSTLDSAYQVIANAVKQATAIPVETS